MSYFTNFGCPSSSLNFFWRNLCYTFEIWLEIQVIGYFAYFRTPPHNSNTILDNNVSINESYQFIRNPIITLKITFINWNFFIKSCSELNESFWLKQDTLFKKLLFYFFVKNSGQPIRIALYFMTRYWRIYAGISLCRSAIISREKIHKHKAEVGKNSEVQCCARGRWKVLV